MARASEDSIGARRPSDALLKIVGLSAAADRYPQMLSGGMQKRAAMARVLANDPDVAPWTGRSVLSTRRRDPQHDADLPARRKGTQASPRPAERHDSAWLRRAEAPFCYDKCSLGASPASAAPQNKNHVCFTCDAKEAPSGSAACLALSSDHP
jgi:hypothetical protein